MEALQVSKMIELVIVAIREEGQKSKGLIENRAVCISNYDKAIAIEILRLKESGTPATISEKVAKGNCWAERLDTETADGEYKAHFARIDYLKAQLNGYQSINRHIAEM